MKKSTKITLAFAVLCLIAGGIGIGTSFTQFRKERLDEEIVLKDNVTSLTIEVADETYFNHISIGSNSDSDSILVNESSFIPTETQANFKTQDKSAHLTLSNNQTKKNKTPIGVNFDGPNQIEIALPNQIKEIKIQSKSDRRHSSTYIHGLTLETLDLSYNRGEINVRDIKADNLHVVTEHGYVSLTDSSIYKKLNVTTANAGINLNSNALIEEANLQSTNGDIQLLASKIITAKTNTEHGMTSLEKVSGSFESLSKDGDIYLVDRIGKSQTVLNTANGNIFAILDKSLADKLPLLTTGEVANTFDAVRQVDDKDDSAKHRLTTKNGQINLLALTKTDDGVEDSNEDFDDDYVYYHIENSGNLPSSVISFDYEFYQDDQIIPFID